MDSSLPANEERPEISKDGLDRICGKPCRKPGFETSSARNSKEIGHCLLRKEFSAGTDVRRKNSINTINMQANDGK
jgi:hypothetical protein